MQQITIDQLQKNAAEYYLTADPETKKFLDGLFGKSILPGKITDRVKTVQDALALDTGWNDEDEKWLTAVKNACIVTRVLNEGWVPDYSNGNEKKWYVWMEYDRASSAFRFDLTYDGYTLAHTGTGSRHVFKTQELARYFAENFTSLINQIILKP